MCAIPRASAVSVLLCIADSPAHAWQASRQIAEAPLALREIDGATIGIEPRGAPYSMSASTNEAHC
jgi:hypothetical protein